MNFLKIKRSYNKIKGTYNGNKRRYIKINRTNNTIIYAIYLGLFDVKNEL